MSPEFGLKSHILWPVCVFFIVLLLDVEFQYSENIFLSSHIFEKLVFPIGFLSFNGTLKMLQNSFHQNSWEIRLLKMAAKSQLWFSKAVKWWQFLESLKLCLFYMNCVKLNGMTDINISHEASKIFCKKYFQANIVVILTKADVIINRVYYIWYNSEANSICFLHLDLIFWINIF